MRFAIYTLGCKVNTYESEVMANLLKEAGYKLIDFNETADIYIINTCTVTDTADKKSRHIINSVKTKNKDSIVIAVGCYSQIKTDYLKNQEIDIIIGNKDKSKIVNIIEEYLCDRKQKIIVSSMVNQKFEDMSVIDYNSKTRSFVKIQDGCNNYCTYCIIPYVRGNIRSKDKNKVIDEIKHLVEKNYQEVVLTGIHTGSYGSDLENCSFNDLLKDIVKIKGLKRLRISSIEITELNQEFLDILSREEVIVNHLHIPLQSGSDKILKLMNRKYDREFFKDKIEEIRKIRSDISITTDVIVGFPNEDEFDFDDTYQFIKELSFSKLHVFPYSKREHTKASMMDNQLDNKTKKIRVKKLISLSCELEINYMKRFVNSNIDVLFETQKNGYLIGHTSNYIMVMVKSDLDLINKIVNVKIIDINYPNLIGIIID